jgi:hypothetical protein
MFERSLNPQEVIGLLSKLKASTPDYPADLMAARKAAFMKQAIAIKFHGHGHSGKGGGDGGSAGSGGSSGSGALGGMSTAQGIMLQAVIGVWIIAAMLAAAYVFRNQIIDFLQNNHLISVEVTQVPSIDSTLPDLTTPATEATPTSLTTTATLGAPSSESPSIEVTPDGSSNIQNAPEGTKENPGLHLGQTPGPPDTPNQDNPDKPNKPDQPDNPNKPSK